MNRFTILLTFIAFSQLTSLAQTDHGFHPNIPSCAFDELNEINGRLFPQLERERQRFLDEAVPVLSVRDKSLAAPLLTISVVVHIIHNGEAVGQGQNLSKAQVQAQIAILNQDFTSLNPQFEDTPERWKSIAGTPNIQFCLASVDPGGGPTNGIARHNLQVTGDSWSNNNVNSEIKPATKWDPLRYFNIYVVPIPGTTEEGGVVGYSNYPTTSLIGAAQDGVVIDYRWFGAPGFASSGWRVLTHETGHYLGLPHTFNGSSCFTDDGIADTPEIEKSTREYVTMDCSNGYPTGPVSCGNEHLYVNYMDYVTENCYTSLTNGQVNVMRAVLDGTSQGYGYGSRQSLIANASSQCALAANDAGITKLVSPQTSDCITGAFAPQITLRNFGVAALNSVQIVTQINAATVNTMNWTGSLAPGENLDLTLPNVNPPDGNFTLNILTANPNQAPDGDTSNDSVSRALAASLSFAPPVFEDFENETAFPTADGIFEFNVNNDIFKWQLTSLVSGFGQGGKSAMFDNFAGTQANNPFGTLDALITQHFDFSNAASTELKFDVAYAPFSSFLSDTLIVMVATDCSQAFDQFLLKKGGADLSTAPATAQAFVPTSAQWRTEILDLSAFSGKKSVRIAFLNISGWGNRLYIDNIQVGVDCSNLTAQLSTTGAGCTVCNGQAQVVVGGGSGNFGYQWSSGGQNSSTVNGLCAGPVSVTVTDALGCSVTGAGDIAQAAAPSVSINQTNETAYAAKNGAASASATGGAPPYTYQWSNGSTGASVSNLSPGGYWVKVKDSQLCETTANFSILAFDCGAFSVTAQAVHVSCFGGANGSLMAVPNSGTAPFNYNWSNGLQTQAISGLPVGAYTVTASDANNCPATKTATIGQPSALAVGISAAHETANNAQNGTAAASVNGGSPGYAYAWSNGATSSSINNLAPGFYTLTVTDLAGCTKTASVTINSFSCSGFQTSISSTDVTCFGLQNGSASVAVSGGNLPVNYVWSNGQTAQGINNLPPGNYTVTVTDATACSSQLSTTIVQPSVLTPNASAVAVSGVGATDGSASANPNGGTAPYQYLWSNGGTGSSIQNLPPGNYSVTVTDMKNCSASQTVTVAGTQCNLSISVAAFPTICPNIGQGSAEVSEVLGASGQVAYLWSNGSNSFFINNLLAGNYSVTVSDGVGCTASEAVQVTSMDVQAPVLITQNITLELGAGGAAILNPEAISFGSFDNCSLVNIGAAPIEFDCSDVGPNMVVVTATDASGNSSQGTAIVTIVDGGPPAITCPADITTAVCSGVFYTLPTATDNCGTPTVSLAAGLASGAVFPVGTSLVTWRAIGPNGLTANCTFHVTLENDLVVSVTNIEHATNGQSNGAIHFSVTGGNGPYFLSWMQNSVVIPAFNPEQAPAGTYQLAVTDANGCSALSSLAVVDNLTATNEAEMERLVRVFPNPTNGIVKFEITQLSADLVEVKVFDVHGKQLLSFKNDDWQGQAKVIDLKNYGPGVYWLKIMAKGQSVLKRIVKI